MSVTRWLRRAIVPILASRPDGWRTRRVRPFLLALLLTLGVAGVTASPAWAQAKARSTIKCTTSSTLAVTWTFSEFPTGENKIKEEIKLDGVIVYTGVFTFTGPSAENTVTISISPGHHEITVFAHWNGNGVKGQSDHLFKNGIQCDPYTIEKQQKIFGSGNEFTKEPLSGEVGQTVEYEIIVKNIGNTSLKFTKLSDSGCEGISPSGEVELAAGGEQIYTCEHILTLADQTAGSHENSAAITGTPPKGTAVTHTSNTVVVTVSAKPGAAPLTPGYWKNHLSEGSPNTQQFLPQSIGNYKVETTTQASAIFTAMTCSNAPSSSQNAIGCLAGHLLATELNLAHGSETCISAAVTKANSWLEGNTQDSVPGVVYAGPYVSYTLTQAQRDEAIALKNPLDKYNNGGGC